ncbi:hypothetical protein CC86DRAFT_442928 [Ophiobolus disseminans]|uniref:DUF7779 domain-containing protein n=1 Tax=Ophiobolus disseminans TaxID=1469910 RepID=A0A6A7AER5_9PLEO|nr:hypothetical protein CC86DRAFT_442928 [Ophiobolus disseminans]
MLFEQIQQERRLAAELLSLMSFFNPQSIPEPTLRRYSKGAAQAANAEDKEEADSTFDEDLDTLQAYSLVSVTADNDACEMHALVQFCMQVWLASCSHAAQWEQRFLMLMAQELPSGEYENWAECLQLFPYVEPLFKSEPAAEEALNAWAQKQGNYSTAQNIAAKALAARERVLALVLQGQGKYKEAEKLNWQALEGRKKELGVRHPDTLTSVDNLASVLRDQGKYKEAEKLNWRALEGYEKEQGVRHPDTLTSVSNLAGVLQDQGKYKEAEKLNWRALEGSEKEFGVRHPDTLTSVYCLAHLLHTTKRYAEAAEFHCIAPELA